MKILMNARGTLVAVLLFAMTSVSAQEPVNNPDLVMDLKWEIGSWSDVWRIGQFESDAVRNKTSVRIFVGADDGLLAWNRNYHTQLDELGIEHEWGVVPKSPHDLEIVMQNWQGDFFAHYRRAFADSASGDRH